MSRMEIQRLLAGLVSRRNFPALYTDKLQLCLDNRLFGQFDALFQQLTLHEKQLFRYADRLHRMAQREFDEDLLQGKGKKLPPILTELPPFGKSEFREFVYRKARELYVRNFWLSLGGKHPRVEDRDQFKMLLEQKVKISTIGPLITNAVIQQWLRQHPECQEAGYSFSDQVASGGELQLSVRDPHANLYYNPYQYWQVRDETTKTDVPAESGWTLDREKYTVTVKNTIPGHRYAVYYFARHGTGLNLSLQSEEQLARYLADWEKFCRENQGKILFHHMDGCFHYFTGKRMKWWEFWGYNGCNANPAAQKAFEEFSGMKFRPAMLFASLDGPAINYTPTPEIRAWMRFNQHLVTGFMKRVADIARQNGMMYQFYWGDKHLGFEPDLDAFEKTGIQSIARPLQDAVDVRSMTEQNGKALTSGRLEWLFAHMVNRPDSIAKILDNWQRNRRGELFRIRDMHYFAEFGPVFAYGDAATQDLYMRMFQRINEEFLLMYKYMHDQKIFTHDLNVYVINEWGRQYSWRPWRDPFLRHFTDIPVNMKWISLREIAENGVPEDAAVLLNYGDRGSAWVGTESWRDPRLAANIRNFVKNGGGFLGCGSAADYQGKNQLADVLGFEYVPGPGGNTLNPTAAGEAFLARSIPGSFSGEPFRCDRNILPAPTFTLLASADGKNPVRPLFGENRYGRGRSVYLSFQSNDPEYDDLIKRGNGEMKGDLSWDSVPFALDLPSLSGKMSLKVQAGQFLKADPGAAKLLSVISLQSLPRRLNLDFRDIFSKGFAFDEITANATIANGIMNTENLKMNGVNATVLMNGSVNIARESQNLHVVIIPEINAAAASIAYGFINPAIGVGTFLAQMFLREPLMKQFTHEYSVTGSWKEPVIREIKSEPGKKTGETDNHRKE